MNGSSDSTLHRLCKNSCFDLPLNLIFLPLLEHLVSLVQVASEGLQRDDLLIRQRDNLSRLHAHLAVEHWRRGLLGLLLGLRAFRALTNALLMLVN